jgi:hypothetical protein
MTRNSSVGIATGYRLDGRGSIPGRGKGFFSTPQRPDGPTQSRKLWLLGDISPWVKRLGREADHTSPYSAEAKNGRAIRPFPHTYS